MAEKKQAKKELSLDEQLKQLKADLLEQERSVKTGTATNVRVARKTRKEIARVLTKINSKKEGERS